MPIFHTTFLIDGPQSVVAAFHHDTSALKVLNPPGVVVQLHHVEPLAEGSVSEFTLWFGPFPIRWKAVHRDVSELGFTDVQVSGPAAAWVHTHRYEAAGPQQTRMTEHIEYEHKPGWQGWVTRLLFSPLNLKFLFAYRRWATGRAVARMAKEGKGR